MKGMHRKLMINVQDIEKQYQNEEQSNQEQEIAYEQNEQQDIEQQEQQQYSEHDSQEDEEGSEQNQNYNSGQQEQGSVKIHENVQTFANKNYAQRILKSVNVNPHFEVHEYKEKKTSYLLPQTPIQMNKSPNLLFKKQQRQQQSNLQDEVDRIINKVLKKKNPTKSLKVNSYKKQLEKVRKIDKINKDLLHENAQLITKINELQKKVNELNGKMLNRSKCEKNKDKSIQCFDDKSLLKTLKVYRQKMEKALQLNTKLSSRLHTQKSKSQLLSQAQRSILNQGQAEKQIGGISTIRSQSIRDEAKIDKNKLLNITQKFKDHQLYCNCGKMKRKIEPIYAQRKETSSRAILQVVNEYRVNSLGGKHNQMPKNHRKQLRHTYCQVNLDQMVTIEQYQFLITKQQELQKQVDSNNNKIQQYQRYLLEIVEFD